MVQKISFFRSYYESVKNLDPETYKEALNTMFKYVFENEEISPDASPTVQMFWTLTKPVVDKSLNKAKAGEKGGKASKEKEVGEGKGNKELGIRSKDKGVRNKDIGVGKSKTEANGKQPVSKTEANGKQNESKTLSYDADALREAFNSQELADTFGDWLDCRSAVAPYPPQAIADDLSKARSAEQRYGAQTVIDVIKSSFSYKRIVWDRLEKKKPSDAQSGGDDVFMKIANGEMQI